MPPKKRTSTRGVIKQPEEGGHAQLQQAQHPALPSSHQSSSSSSSSSSSAAAAAAASAARLEAVTAVTAVAATTEPTRRVTRSSSKALQFPALISNQPNQAQRRKSKAHGLDSGGALLANRRTLRNTSKQGTTTLPQEQNLQPVEDRSSPPQRTITEDLQPISAWAAGIEGGPTSQPSPYSSSTAGQEGFWKSRGYDLPDTSTASMSSSINNTQTTDSKETSRNAKTKSQITEKNVTTVNVKSAKFPAILLEHNINFVKGPVEDERLEEWKKLVWQNLPHGQNQEGNDVGGPEIRWQRDMSKCKVSNEAIFQRTIMMDIIERDELGDKLDYMCEVPWVADRMPRRNEAVKLAQPKPDLAVAFKTASILPAGFDLTEIMSLGKLTANIFTEGMKKGEIDRSFYFLSIEVKGKGGQIGNTEAEYQNLNTAAQALHNIYLVMRKAKQEEIFFNKVRFFSIVATAATFELRVHRPTRLRETAYIEPEYGAKYSFDEVLTIGADYTKAMASTIVYNILFHYGVAKLFPILRRALDTVLKPNFGTLAEAPATSQRGKNGTVRTETKVAQQLSPGRSKRSGEDDLGESLGSHASRQRRRLGELLVNDG